MRKRRLLTQIAISGLFVLLISALSFQQTGAAPAASSHPEVKLMIISATSGQPQFIISQALVELINKDHPWLRASNRASLESTKITLGAFIVPYLAIFAPALLFMPQNPFSAGVMILSSILLVIILQFVVCGQFFTRLNLVERLIFLVPVILFVSFAVIRNFLLFIVGIAFVLILTFVQIKKRNSVSMGSRLGTIVR